MNPEEFRAFGPAPDEPESLDAVMADVDNIIVPGPVALAS